MTPIAVSLHNSLHIFSESLIASSAAQENLGHRRHDLTCGIRGMLPHQRDRFIRGDSRISAKIADDSWNADESGSKP